jgi:hypothetical protein
MKQKLHHGLCAALIILSVSASTANAEDKFDKKNKIEKALLPKAVYEAQKKKDAQFEKYKKETNKKPKPASTPKAKSK